MIAAVLVGLVVIVLLWMYFNGESHPIDKLPGPPRLPIIGNTHQLMRSKPDELLYELVDYTNTYGDKYVFNIMGLRVLHIANPADIEVVLSHTKNIKKSLPYRFLEDWLGSGLLLSTGAHWHKRRKILTPTFHFNILKNFANVMEEKCKDLVHMLKEKKGEYVSLTPVISDYTLFTICETAMGTKLDADQSGSTLEYKNAILKIGLLLLNRVMKFWAWSDFMFKKTADGKEFMKIRDIAASFAEKVILDRKAQRAENKVDDINVDSDVGTKRRLAMLDLLLEAEEKGEIDMQGIKDEVNTFMFEGHDTTACAITCGLMLLAEHEDVQERLYEEVQSVLGDSDCSPTMSEMANMKYLEAFIKETLRLYPSVPFIGRSVVEDFKLGDILVKKGTVVDLHFYELHRRADSFPDPEAFKPERFLGTEMKHPYAYVPFSAGPRNCIGQRYAMLEMKLTFCEIVRNFKLAPKVKGARPKMMADLVLRPVDPIYVKFIPRQ